MWWVYAALLVLLVLSPAILYGLALVVAALTAAFYRRPCPKCGRRGLRSTNFIRATVLIDGQRAADHWAYYVCNLCESGFKLHRGKWLSVEAAELERYNSGRP
jgi:hypothetical protein